MRLNLFSYSGTGNLGDAIQTIALRGLIKGAVSFRDRDTGAGAEAHDLHFANGYLDARWLPGPARVTVFAGVHVPDEWMARRVRAATGGRVIGARDPWSQQVLAGKGANAQLIGCATLTFERYEGPRRGIFAVDASEAPADAERLTHFIPATMSWAEQLATAERCLDRYRTAEAVFTTRLHVLLPCLAFGTPVYLEANTLADAGKLRRFSLAQALGVWAGRLVTLDVSKLASAYRRFLKHELGWADRKSTNSSARIYSSIR